VIHIIVCDSRETKCIKLLQNRKADMKKEFLEVGDFLLPDGYAIERKKGKDFIASISDKRLYSQLNNLYQYEKPIIAIITDNIWREFYFSKNRYIHNSYKGCLTTITAKYPKANILQFENDEDFIDFLIGLDKKLTEEGKGVRPAPMMRRATSPREAKENVLASIKGVGVKMSKKLLHRYKSVNGVSNATVDDMIEIKKLGKVVAERIKEVLN